MNDTELIQAAANLCSNGIRDIAPRFTPKHADSKQEALDQLLNGHRRLGTQTNDAIEHWLSHGQMPNVSEEIFEQIFFRFVGFQELFQLSHPGIRLLAFRNLDPQNRTAKELVRHTTIAFWNDSGWPKRLLMLILQRVQPEEPDEIPDDDF